MRLLPGHSIEWYAEWMRKKFTWVTITMTPTVLPANPYCVQWVQSIFGENMIHHVVHGPTLHEVLKKAWEEASAP